MNQTGPFLSASGTHALLALGAFAIGSICGCSPAEDTVGIVTHTAPQGDGGSGELCVADAALKQRPEGTALTLIAGEFEDASATTWRLLRNGQYVTLTGQGYLCLRWLIEYSGKAGLITPPTIAVDSGSFIHVGGGGDVNLGDPQPGTTGTWMGNDEEGLSYMPEGVPTPWKNEFYHLDGQVTIAMNESDGLYNITVYTQTYDDVASSGWGVYDPGVVCDPE